ncbi:MAG: hypothetical protein ACOX6I_07875 [Syntrophomonadaceae bacterium]|jgi:hypothetical protein
MAGRIKQIIDIIVEKRANGNATIETLTKSKMVMKGIMPDKYTSSSDDDPQVIEKLMALAKELNVNI